MISAASIEERRGVVGEKKASLWKKEEKITLEPSEGKKEKKEAAEVCIYISYPPILQLRPMVGVCTMHSGALGGFSWGSAGRFNEKKKERKKKVLTLASSRTESAPAHTYIHLYI